MSRSARTPSSTPEGNVTGSVRAAADSLESGPTAPRNTLRIIELLTDVPSIGVTELARRLGAPTANVYRLLRVLEAAGYVEQNAGSKHYRLTLKLFELGNRSASRVTIRDLAAVEMERLSRQTGMAVNFGTLVGSEVMYLEKIQTDDILVLNLPPGRRAPATCTGMGKAILAFDHRPFTDLVGPGPYPAKTERSVTTADALRDQLDEARRLGYSIDREELASGFWCVAAPVLSGVDDILGALSVSVFRPSMADDELHRLGLLVVAAARRIGGRAGSIGQISSW